MGEGVQISNIAPWLVITYVLSVSALALWRGGPSERLIAVLQVLMVVNGYGHFYPPATPAFFDVVEFVACLACTLRSRSYWTLWASAGFLLSVMTSFLYYSLTGIGHWAYISAELVWLFISTTALLCGAFVGRTPRFPGIRTHPVTAPEASHG